MNLHTLACMPSSPPAIVTPQQFYSQLCSLSCQRWRLPGYGIPHTQAFSPHLALHCRGQFQNQKQVDSGRLQQRHGKVDSELQREGFHEEFQNQMQMDSSGLQRHGNADSSELPKQGIHECHGNVLKNTFASPKEQIGSLNKIHFNPDFFNASKNPETDVPTRSGPDPRYAEPAPVCDDATHDESVKPRAVRCLPASYGYSSHILELPSWSIAALILGGVFAAGLALGSWRLSSRNNSGFPLKMHEVQVHGLAKEVSEQLLGHFRAEEAPQSDLKAVLADHSVTLRTAAADAFLKMQGAARQEGVWLIPLSGFRSIQVQKEVFYDIKVERGQRVIDRAKVSAPPGYSEHHTGYALDIGDSSAVWTHLEKGFEQTAAFDWLKGNAARFHFEMSFPLDNEYGVMYEPWHWRFVGDDESLRIFFSSRSQAYLHGCHKGRI